MAEPPISPCPPRPVHPRMRLGTLVLLLSSSFLVAATPAEAQGRLTLELRGGVSVPSGGLGKGPLEAGELGAGPAFGMRFSLRRSRWVDLYAGFSELRFDCGADGCAGDGRLVSTVWNVGANLRARSGLWGPWLRVGLVAGAAEFETADPDGGSTSTVSRVTDTGVGGEIGTGWRIRLADAWGVSPGVRYSRWDARVDEGTLYRMSYWVADLGLVLAF